MEIHVGSLPFKLKEKQLREIFEKFGQVYSAVLIIDRRTGQNKGYGFVDMPDDQEALAAIKALHGTEIMGRAVTVQKSEGDKNAPGQAKREKARTKKSGVWKSKLYPKKKKENVIDKHSDDLKKEKKKKRGGVKLAKNFKVGKRKR